KSKSLSSERLLQRNGITAASTGLEVVVGGWMQRFETKLEIEQERETQRWMSSSKESYWSAFQVWNKQAAGSRQFKMLTNLFETVKSSRPFSFRLSKSSIKPFKQAF